LGWQWSDRVGLVTPLERLTHGDRVADRARPVDVEDHGAVRRVGVGGEGFSCRVPAESGAGAGLASQSGCCGGAVVTVRRLAPIECERLQGFPDDWTAVDAGGQRLSDTARYRLMGNAATVPVVAWIAARLQAAHHATRAGRPVGPQWSPSQADLSGEEGLRG
jgi:hypothetical protein